MRNEFSARVEPSQDQDLIQLLFEANHRPDGWQLFLNAFVAKFRLNSCHLYAYHTQTMDIRFQEWAGVKPNEAFYQSYVEEFIHIDPLQLALDFWPEQTFYSTSLHDPVDPIKFDRFFKYWCTPQGMIAGSACAISRNQQWNFAINHTRNDAEGHYSEDDIQRMNNLAPYLKKALDIRVKIAEQGGNTARLKQVLDSLPLAAALFNEFGELIVVNSLMQKDLIDSRLFSFDGNKQLDFGGPQRTQDMYVNITERVCASKGLSLVYQPEDIVLPVAPGQSYYLHAEELLEQDKESGECFVGVIVYAVADFDSTLPSADYLQQKFGFTPAEAQSSLALCRGKSMKSSADELGKSVYTLKEQLSACYNKAGVKGQLELVSLLRALPLEQRKKPTQSVG